LGAERGPEGLELGLGGLLEGSWVWTGRQLRGVECVRGLDRVELALGAEVIARHVRSFRVGSMVIDPLQVLELLEQKHRAVAESTAIGQWELPSAFYELREKLRAKVRKPDQEWIGVLRRLERQGMAEVEAAVQGVRTVRSLASRCCPHQRGGRSWGPRRQLPWHRGAGARVVALPRHSYPPAGPSGPPRVLPGPALPPEPPPDFARAHARAPPATPEPPRSPVKPPQTATLEYLSHRSRCGL
jgi:hypothetical protein